MRREPYPSTWAHSQARLPGSSEGKECRRHKFNPWVGKIWEKEVATHSSILAWETHRQRSLAGYGPWNSRESDTTEQLNNNTARPTKGRGLRVAWRCPKMPYWNGAAPYSPCPPTMSSACLLPMKNFSQRISLIRKMKNIETKKLSKD